MRRSRFGNEETLTSEALVAYNTTLAKLLQRLKKDAGAERVMQTSQGKGRFAFRRQLYVRFKSGANIDLVLDHGWLMLSPLFMSSGQPFETPVRLPKGVGYAGRSPAEVYDQTASILRAWANPSGSFRRRSRWA